MTTETAIPVAASIRTLVLFVERERKALDEAPAAIAAAFAAGWVQTKHIESLAQYAAISYDLKQVEEVLNAVERGEATAQEAVQLLEKEAIDKLTTIPFGGSSTNAVETLVGNRAGTFWQRLRDQLDYTLYL